MSDPTNIRLTNFTKGLQTVDKLDYPVDAVRAGSNIDISKRIRTRGGISTVDSVGLPANSEIMSLQQVKFPTNEKTYLVAQVHVPASETPQDFESTELEVISPTIGFRIFDGTEDIQVGGENAQGDTRVTLTDLKVLLDTTTILDLQFSSTGVTDSRQGNATVNGTWEDIYDTIDGIQLNDLAYLTFPSQVANDWFSDFASADTITYKFKLKFEFDSYSYADVPTAIILLSNGSNNFRLSIDVDGSEGAEATSTAVHVVEWAEILWGVMFDPSIIDDGDELAFTLWYSYTEDGEFGDRYYNDWHLTIGTDYADTPIPASWALYALPDTLPDTGA